MHLFFVTYSVNNLQREQELISALKELGDTNQVLQNSYFLLSDSKRNDIYVALKNALENDGLFIVTECNLDTMSGWVPSQTIDWLNQVNTDN